MTSERASCHVLPRVRIQLRHNETRGRKRGFGEARACAASGFWGCLLHTTSSHPWKSPSACQRSMNVKDQTEHPSKVTERQERSGSPTKSLPNHQKIFPLHFQTCKAVEQMATVLCPHAMALSIQFTPFSKGVPIQQHLPSAGDHGLTLALFRCLAHPNQKPCEVQDAKESTHKGKRSSLHLLHGVFTLKPSNGLFHIISDYSEGQEPSPSADLPQNPALR